MTPRFQRKPGYDWETGAMVYRFTKFEDDPDFRPKKGKNKGKLLPKMQLTFEVEDLDGQEDFAGQEINHTLWYSIDDEGNNLLSKKGVQVMEAVQGGQAMDEGDESEDLDDCVDNLVVIHITATDDDDFPNVVKVEPYDEDKKKKKRSRRSKSKDREEKADKTENRSSRKDKDDKSDKSSDEELKKSDDDSSDDFDFDDFDD